MYLDKPHFLGELDATSGPYVQLHQKLKSVLRRRTDWLGRDEKDRKSDLEKSEFKAAFEALLRMWQLISEAQLGLIQSSSPISNYE